MIGSYWEAAGFALMALAVLQLLWLLGLQLVGDMRESAMQARLKRLAGKKPQKATIVVLAGTDTPVTEVLDSIQGETAAEILLFAPARSKAYNQARRYRQKQGLGARLRVLQRPAPSKLLKAVYQRSTGALLVLLDENVRIREISLATRLMASPKLQAVVLTPGVRLDSSLANGIYAAWQVLTRHFNRAYNSVQTPKYGLVVRKNALRNQARRKQPDEVHTVADAWNAFSPAIRTSALQPRSAALHAQRSATWRDLLHHSVAMKHVLLVFFGPAAIIVALVTLGSYQGMIVLGFAALLLMFLAALAVWSEPKLDIMARINTLLLTPFAYAWFIIAALLSVLRLPFRLLKP